MNDPIRKDYQKDALQAIHTALYMQQKTIVVEMASGLDNSILLEDTVAQLLKNTYDGILIITATSAQKQQMDTRLTNALTPLDKSRVTIESQKIASLPPMHPYSYVIFFEAKDPCIADMCEKQPVILFTLIHPKASPKFYNPKDVVFSYGYEQAILDGALTPSMGYIQPAIQVFCTQLFEQYGYTDHWIEPQPGKGKPDLVVQKDGQYIVIEYKSYKRPSAPASAILSVAKSMRTYTAEDMNSTATIPLIIVLNHMSNSQKAQIYNDFGVVVWDISNVLFYARHDLSLLKLLSQITYFTTGDSEGAESEEAKKAGFPPTPSLGRTIDHNPARSQSRKF